MKPSLQVRLSQHLALTPQLQQSIRLLQLSTLELHQEVEQMLEQNPFLETEEDTSPVFEPLSERLRVPSVRASARRRTLPKLRAGATRLLASTPRSSAEPSARTGRTEPSATTSTAFGRRRAQAARAATTTKISTLKSAIRPHRLFRSFCAINCPACDCRLRTPPHCTCSSSR